MKQVSSWALVLLFWLHQAYAERPTKTPGYTIPIVDLANETHRQVLVDREAGQYLGHPTTVLLEDNKTMITVYPKGHGKGGGSEAKGTGKRPAPVEDQPRSSRQRRS